MFKLPRIVIIFVAGGWWLVAGGWWLVAGVGGCRKCPQRTDTLTLLILSDTSHQPPVVA